MTRMPNRLLGWTIVGSLLAALFCLPRSTLAQDAASALATAPEESPGTGTMTDGKKAGDDILNLDIEQLAKTPVVVPSMDIPVTSVTKEQSTVGRSPAAVFVVSQEMIRRSGATSIPEALRMAPGMEVARINSDTWAVTCRGFNARYADKLLVLIDGRTVYTPTTSGVNWDTADVLLEDVDRIEVIRGPAGTLWGANAVNGVINVVTKSAKDTQGTYVSGGGGTQERMLDAARYGGQIGDDFHYRVYGKHFERSNFFTEMGEDAHDAWRQGRFGFRGDWAPGQDKSNHVTVEGDVYTGLSGDTSSRISTLPPFSQSVVDPQHVSGQDLIARWRHVYDEDSDWSLQMYYDQYVRDDNLIHESAKTLDVEFQYRFPLTDRHSITCGGGFRNVVNNQPSADPFTESFLPPNQTNNTTNQFIQDEMALAPERLTFTMGVKLEENSYTGLEYQPSMRLLYTPDNRHSAWGAISRAVRIPSRSDEDLSLTLAPVFPETYPRVEGSTVGGLGLQSENEIAYELGYREQMTDNFSWDIATYYSQYRRLRTLVPGGPYLEFDPPPPHAILPLVISNGPAGATYGVELATTWSVSKQWRLRTQYTFFQMRLDTDDMSLLGGRDPRHQVYLTSSWDLRNDITFDVMARYVDNLTAIDIPSYITMDARLAWRPRKHIEVAVVGQNLLQSEHLEFVEGIGSSGVTTVEIPRGIYGTITLRR